MANNGIDGFDEGPALFIGMFQGFRSWHIYRTEQGRRLHSATYDYNWTPGVNTAQCFRSAFGNTSPNPECLIEQGKVSDGCGHGLWAYTETAHDYLNPGTMRSPFNANYRTTACGVIASFGSTVVGPKGFRSYRARVLALGPVHLPATQETLAKSIQAELADYYRVPAYPTLQALLAQWPLTSIAEFLPEQEAS
jgi:hypothetical protein